MLLHPGGRARADARPSASTRPYSGARLASRSTRRTSRGRPEGPWAGPHRGGRGIPVSVPLDVKVSRGTELPARDLDRTLRIESQTWEAIEQDAPRRACLVAG